MALPLNQTERNRLYSAEEFMALPDDGNLYELIMGVIQPMSQPGEAHALVQDNLNFLLGSFVRAHKLGRLLPTARFDLKIDPKRDNVRSPDLALLLADQITWQSGAITQAPALAIEILSPNDRPGQLKDKLRQYQAAGWNMLWVIDPDRQQVNIYHLQESLNPLRTLGSNDQLEGEEVLAGFSLAVKSLFE